MERRLLLVLAPLVLVACGCSKKDQSPRAAAAPAMAKATAAASTEGAAGLPVPAPQPSPAPAPPAMPSPALPPTSAAPAAETLANAEQLRLEQGRAQAEDIRRRLLDDLERNKAAGMFGSPIRGDAEMPQPGTMADALAQNPLRADTFPPAAAQSSLSIENRLRETKREPRIATSAAVAAPSPFGPPATDLPIGGGSPHRDMGPAGGSAPPIFGIVAPPEGVPLAPQTSASVGVAPTMPAGGAAPSPAVTVPPITVPPITAPQMEPPQAPVGNGNDHDIVEVLYGTDRQPGDRLSSAWPHLLSQFFPTVFVGLVAGG